MPPLARTIDRALKEVYAPPSRLAGKYLAGEHLEVQVLRAAKMLGDERGWPLQLLAFGAFAEACDGLEITESPTMAYGLEVGAAGWVVGLEARRAVRAVGPVWWPSREARLAALTRSVPGEHPGLIQAIDFIQASPQTLKNLPDATTWMLEDLAPHLGREWARTQATDWADAWPDALPSPPVRPRF